MIGQVIDARFFKVLDYPTAASLSVVLMVAILVLVGCTSGAPGRRTCCEPPCSTASRRRPRRRPRTDRAAGSGHDRAGLRRPRVRVPDGAGRLHGRVLVQRRRQDEPGVARLHPGNWQNPCGAPQVCEAFANSLQVGVVATVLATALGTLVAIALVRFRFRGRALTNLLIFLPMSTPEVVLGAALLAQFLTLRLPLGFGTVVAAHVLFCISFVVVTVKARCPAWTRRSRRPPPTCTRPRGRRFWRVTFPLLIPGSPRRRCWRSA